MGRPGSVAVRPVSALVIGIGLALWIPSVGVGQEAAIEEADLLRRASGQEEAGEMAAAESALRAVLARRPQSLPALLALERVLRTQRRLDELVPAIQAALAEEATAPVSRLLIRTLSDLDRTAELEAAAAAWIAREPGMEVPYREVAEVWRDRGEYGRAREVLEDGRRRMGSEDALALELGDVYAELGELTLAVREWAGAVDDRGGGASRVRRRLRSLPPGSEGLALELVDRVSREPVSTGRLEAAVELALTAGLEERTWELVERLAPRLEPERREAMLDGVARRADAAGLERLAYQAYGAVLELGPDADHIPPGGGSRARSGARVLAIRGRRAELALSLGDTAAAARGYAALERAAEAEPETRSEATAERIDLLAARDPDRAREELRAFVAGHPESPAIDRLSAAVARGLEESGRPGDAELVLAGVAGPRSAWVRAGLLLERGDPARAREELVRAAVGLRGAEATRALTLARLLVELTPDGTRVVAGVLRRRDRGEPEEAVDGGLEAIGAVERRDRAPLLDFLAEIAAGAGLERRAEEIRRRIVAEHPASDEAPRALLALGRALAGATGGHGEADREEARELLERLVLEYPTSALVPQARRELDRLRQGGEGVR